MLIDQPPAKHDSPPLPAEPHDSGPPAKPPRRCAYENPCRCRPSGFCLGMMTEVVNMLERGR